MSHSRHSGKITESSKQKETFKVIESNHQPSTTTVTSKPWNVGQNRDFSTAENFGICIQTRKHKRFLTRERALCGTQDFQEELQQATKLDLQTGRPSETSRERI